MTAAERRKKYLVEKKFQLKPVYILAIAFIIITAIIEWQIYSFLKIILPHITLLETRSEILRLGISIMLQLFLIFLIITILSILYLHRFVGPIKRLCKELDEMAESNNYHLLKLRKNDALKPFVDSLNKTIAKLIK